MLLCKGLYVNCWHREDGLAFDVTRQMYRGCIPNTKGYVGTPLILSGEVRKRGFFTNKSGSQSGEKNLTFFSKGVVIEQKRDRLNFLRKIRDASPIAKRDRINIEISSFERSTRQIPDWYPTSVWACDGVNLFVSGPGIFDTETVLASNIKVEGKSVAQHLTTYFGKHMAIAGAESAVRKMLGEICFTKVEPLENRKPTAGDLYECASFGLVMSQIRGFVPEGYTFGELGNEYATVLNGLQTLYAGGIDLHALHVNFARFISEVESDVRVAEKIAPYVACKVTPFISDNTGSKLNNLSFASLVNAKDVSFSGQGKYSIIRRGDDMIQLDIRPDVIQMMFDRKDLVNKLALRILYNCQTYSYAVSETSTWATSLYCSWRGLPGVIGSLSFGI